MGGGNKYLTANNKQRTAFVHNPGSKKTAHILSLPNEGLCYTCHETIEWKKRYRKYKPLTVPGKCAHCHQKTVRRAYHLTCDDCTLKLQVCGKCQKPKDIIKEIVTKEVEIKEQAEIRDALKDMTERERRTFYRDLEKGEEKKDKKEKKGNDDQEENDDEQDDDEDYDDDDEEDSDEDYEDEDEDEDDEDYEPSAPKTRAQLTVKSVTQDIKKLTTVFTNDQVGQLMKNSKKSTTTTTASTPTKKPSSATNEEDEDEDEEEDDAQVLSAEKMYLKLKEQYKSKSKTEKQSNNLVNNEEDEDEEDEEDEDAIDEDDEDYEEDDDEEDN